MSRNTAVKVYHEFGLEFVMLRIVLCFNVLLLSASTQCFADHELSRLSTQFQQYTGVPLVFDRADLPPSDQYFDKMPSLRESARADAARVLLNESKKYPPGFLGRVGIEAVGVFSACVSAGGDGYRPFNAKLGGYKYFGAWNGENAIVAAHYSDEQLPLTFHHEVFHHIDATQRGFTSYDEYFWIDDDRFESAVRGESIYSAAEIASGDMVALRGIAKGHVLEKSVSTYATKSSGEDQAETARYFMATLSDSLIQIAERPTLPGSQRILHILSLYEHSVDDGPTVDWFTSVALGRQMQRSIAAERPQSRRCSGAIVEGLEQFVSTHGNVSEDGLSHVRSLIRKAESTRIHRFSNERFAKLVAAATHRLMKQRIHQVGFGFMVNGTEHDNGVNYVLRDDIQQFGTDVVRLRHLTQNSPAATQRFVDTVITENISLLDGYFEFIRSNWSMSHGTRRVFREARSLMEKARPNSQAPAETDATNPGPECKITPVRTNQYLSRVDEAVSETQTRQLIKGVQPACVKLTQGSGVCISSDGWILTNAHCADFLKARIEIEFPDGRTYSGNCTAIDHHLDLALLKIDGVDSLPFAPIARNAPAVGDKIVCIGQPSDTAPGGEPTGYKPFHVSTGQIRAIDPNPLGSQSLGRTAHDAWTYWGHSGSPLFNNEGAIVALHNSWDSKTYMRHAVPWEAIHKFITEE